MNILNLIKKAVTGGEWSVVYRDSGGNNWKTAAAPDGQWCADPFAFSDGEHHFIFVEQYRKDRDKGCIGYFSFENGAPVNQGIIIENTYHMSYPDVFTYGDRFYMIPESSANDTVDLYTADHFPDRWRKVKTLIQGKKYVDSTVYQDGDRYYLISYTMAGGFEIHVFELDMEKQEVRLLSGKKYAKNVARPGGRLYLENNRLMRPAQDCSEKYGEALILYEVDDLNRNGEYVEHEVKRITADTLRLASRPNRIHQWTGDGTYEAADIYHEKTDLLHFLRIFIRSHRK